MINSCFIILAGSSLLTPQILLVGIIIIALGIFLRHFKQPYIIAYILAGVLMGEYGFKIITDQQMITSLGEIGLILLLFFIGMEINLPNLIKRWKAPFFGTILQLTGSIFLVACIGFFLGWPVSTIVIVGFVISLSSSAVVIKLLQDNGETDRAIGQDVIGILLMQDILIVPLLIATNYLGGHSPATEEVLLQLFGGVIIIAVIIYLLKKKTITLPYSKQIKEDHELQVFIALVVCFGFATITSIFGLSSALGAFVGGMLIHAAHSTSWFHHSLHSFRVLFVAIFFVSIGMLVDLEFLLEHWETISFLLVAVYLSNHFINSLTLRFLGHNMKSSFYGGALLAQIGELSFLITAAAYHTLIITDYTYQMTILVISLTLLFSPFWITLSKILVKY